jgi:AbrB family transcriptional regulator (stage V sporulation protein T)
MSVVICDRDSVVASAGVSKKEYGDKPLSEELESISEGRSFYAYRAGEAKISPLRDGGSHYVSCAMPIISEGDIVGIVAALFPADTDKSPEAVEQKLVQTAASFLGRQMESQKNSPKTRAVFLSFRKPRIQTVYGNLALF